MALHFLDKLRLQHVIPPAGNATFSGNGMPDMNSPQVDDGMQGFTPEHEAADRFTKALDSYPTLHKPGLLRKLGAVAAGTLGADTEETLHPGRAREIQDWKNQIAPLENAANLERYSNTNMRTMQTQSETNKRLIESDLRKDENADAREERLRKEFGENTQLKKDLANIQSTHAQELETLKARHAKELSDATIASREKIAGEGNKSKEKIAEEGNTAKETIASGKNASALNVATFKGQQISNKPESAANEQTRKRVNAETFKRLHPELAQHIVIDKNNPKGFTVNPPSEGGILHKAGPTPQQFKLINDYIENTGKTSSSTEPVKKDTLGLFKK